jgi:Domain of unknown function (DUF4337)
MEDEAKELREAAEKAREDKSLAAVSLTMAVLAVLVAVVTLLSHRAHTEEVVLQAKASDQWSYYQAKNIRGHEDELFVASNSAAADVREKYAQEAERYKHEKDEIQNEARKLESEVETERKRADRYDLAEVFLEIGLVITSITLLSGRKIFWHLGIVFSIAGIVIAASGAVVRMPPQALKPSMWMDLIRR